MSSFADSAEEDAAVVLAVAVGVGVGVAADGDDEEDPHHRSDLRGVRGAFFANGRGDVLRRARTIIFFFLGGWDGVYVSALEILAREHKSFYKYNGCMQFTPWEVPCGQG